MAKESDCQATGSLNTNIEIIRKILWLGEKSIYGIFAISFIIFFVV